MDFDKLLEPYKENGRTVSGQIKWLLKNGIPHTSIDYAMSAVYKRIDSGATYENGHELDRELLTTARDHYNTELVEGMTKRVGEIEANLDVEWNKLTKWQKIRQVIAGKA